MFIIIIIGAYFASTRIHSKFGNIVLKASRHRIQLQFTRIALLEVEINRELDFLIVMIMAFALSFEFIILERQFSGVLVLTLLNLPEASLGQRLALV